MSNYGNPPSDPYGQQPGGQGQDPYGQQPANPYGQPAPAYGQPQAGGLPPGVNFASWGKRVVAYLIDMAIIMVLMIPYYIATFMSASSMEIDPATGQATGGGFSAVGLVLMLISFVAAIAFFVWNTCIKQGGTGYSIGKGVMGIKLVKAENGQPIGAGMSFVRYLAHILDGIPCYVGYLWPLWDANRQTFADKIIGTYVIDQPKG